MLEPGKCTVADCDRAAVSRYGDLPLYICSYHWVMLSTDLRRAHPYYTSLGREDPPRESVKQVRFQPLK